MERPAYYLGMAKLSGKEIQKLAGSIVNENPEGIRYSALRRKSRVTRVESMNL
jgi:hypothetical protein